MGRSLPCTIGNVCPRCAPRARNPQTGTPRPKLQTLVDKAEDRGKPIVAAMAGRRHDLCDCGRPAPIGLRGWLLTATRPSWASPRPTKAAAAGAPIGRRPPGLSVDTSEAQEWPKTSRVRERPPPPAREVAATPSGSVAPVVRSRPLGRTPRSAACDGKPGGNCLRRWSLRACSTTADLGNRRWEGHVHRRLATLLSGGCRFHRSWSVVPSLSRLEANTSQ